MRHTSGDLLTEKKCEDSYKLRQLEFSFVSNIGNYNDAIIVGYCTCEIGVSCPLGPVAKSAYVF